MSRTRTITKIEWEGIAYNSIKECALALGIAEVTVYARYKKGYTRTSDLKPRFGAMRRNHPVEIEGVLYPSEKEAKKELGWSDVDMLKYLSGEGYEHSIVYKGVKFDSQVQAAYYFRVSRQAVSAYLLRQKRKKS